MRNKAVKLEAQIAAQKGLAKALMGSGELLMDAWGMVVGKQAELSVDIEKGSSSTKAAEFVGRAAGLLSDPRVRDDSEVNDRMARIGSAFLEGLAKRIGGFDELDDDEDDDDVIIEGEFKE